MTPTIRRCLARLDGGSITRLQALTDDELHDLITATTKAVNGDTADYLPMINGERFQWLGELQGVQR